MGTLLRNLRALVSLLTLGIFSSAGAVEADGGIVQRRAPVVAPAPATAEIVDRYTDARPWVAIIIDDLGNRPEDRLAALLPGPVACSFLPHTPHAVELAQLAARNGKEVLLHQPMQASGQNRQGPGALRLTMDRASFRDTINNNLASLPHVSGVNNHMGSLLTSHSQAMGWLMEELRRYPSMFFIDSRTTSSTVASRVASKFQIPSSSRDIFLDNRTDPESLLAQFNHLIKVARAQGSAIAIGHPYPETMAFLRTHLADLERQGISLQPVSEVIRLRKPALRTAWHQVSSDQLRPKTQQRIQ